MNPKNEEPSVKEVDYVKFDIDNYYFGLKKIFSIKKISIFIKIF
jgi:hypothetical protein